jgi:uncharacterized membrane protein YvbJ
LVYCPKCGTQNEDDLEVCVNCGASLYMTRREARRAKRAARRRERGVEQECFGLPHGGAIAGIIFGIIIFIWGISLLTGIDIWENIFFIIVIIFGALIIAGSVYKITRR